MIHKVLLIDDDPLHLTSAKEFLERRGFAVRTATCGQEALKIVATSTAKFSAAVVDFQMPGLSGEATIQGLAEIDPSLPILTLSGDPTRAAVLQSHRRGSWSFIDKREGADAFLRELSKLCRRRAAELAVEDTLAPLEQRQQDLAELGLIGTSKAMHTIARQAKLLRDRPGSVLILGESGTGKELIARALHRENSGPFIAVNCADYLLNREMARSELFGHVRGSFTGAVGDHMGVLERAGSGTVFLDEIYALPLEAQVGLLRVLQEKKIQRVGGAKEIPVRCRIVAAAKPDLIQEIATGAFKPDLFYRISQNILTLPRLAERPDDIAPLVAFFTKRWQEETGERKYFLASALPPLAVYPWPGNVRELENFVYGTLNALERSTVRAEDLGVKFKSSTAATDPGAETSSAEPKQTLREALREAERALLVEALRNSSTLAEAARHLGLAPSNLLRSLKKHRLEAAAYLGASR